MAGVFSRVNNGSVVSIDSDSDDSLLDFDVPIIVNDSVTTSNQDIVIVNDSVVEDQREELPLFVTAETERAHVSPPLTLNTLLMRLKKGEVFNSFDEFKNILDKYAAIVKLPYNIGSSHRLETYNAKVSSKSRLPVELTYRRVEFCCVHYGENKNNGSRGQGLRETS